MSQERRPARPPGKSCLMYFCPRSAANPTKALIFSIISL